MGGVYGPLLASHACTKLGSKAWEFVTPLLLLQFSDGTLIAPTVFGLAIFGFKFAFGPAAGRWMDHTERMRVIRYGIALQAVGVVSALGVLGLLVLQRNSSSSDALTAALGGGGMDAAAEMQAATATEAAAPESVITSGGAPPATTAGLPIGLLVAMVACGCAEALGALVSSVAVKKDWVPSIFAPTDPTLSRMNTAMANIDLIAEIVGPLGAGLALQFFGGDAAGGFVLVGLANVVTFGVELVLLRNVFLSNAQLQAPKPVPTPTAASSGEGSGSCGGCCSCGFFSAWPAFTSHPSGIPLLVISYALLYFTVLSPHGVVLTAYLQTRALSPPALATFRALGALAGVAGMGAFRMLSERLGLRRLATLHLWVLALAVAGAASSFAATHGSSGLTTPMTCFLGLVVLSRFGLYGFDVAVLQLQQVHVDETLRGSVGAVESSLCSLGTATLLVGTLLTSASGNANAFDVLVYASSGFVGSAALTYTAWVLLFHEHEHAHPLFEPGGSGGGGVPGAQHKHTHQQMRALEDSTERTHVHLHFPPPWSHALSHLKQVAGGDATAHTHTHGGHTHTHGGH